MCQIGPFLVGVPNRQTHCKVSDYEINMDPRIGWHTGVGPLREIKSEHDRWLLGRLKAIVSEGEIDWMFEPFVQNCLLSE